MSDNLSKRDNKVKENLTESCKLWDKAIEDARIGIVRLKAAIRTYEERKANGDPWPGTGSKEKAGTAA